MVAVNKRGDELIKPGLTEKNNIKKVNKNPAIVLQ